MNRPQVHVPCQSVMALCRPGFERESADEIVAALDDDRLRAPRVDEGSGLVVVELRNIHGFEDLSRAIRLAELTFSRQLAFGFACIRDLPERDRVSPLLERARGAGTPFSALLPEASDGPTGRPLTALGRRLQAPLEREFTKANLLRPKRDHLPRLHIAFTSEQEAWLGVSHADNAAAWPMGIPRLKMPAGAPSRSTLKLAEAFITLLGDDELRLRLRPGQRAVDLGAAPGGWTWQLAQRGLHVTAVDNGPIADSVKATGMVEHIRADGFTWRPRAPVDWLVCDMVEQPGRIAALVADWMAARRCRRAIFNLKLPMKKRLAEIQRCRETIHKKMLAASCDYTLRIKQLYHDREEVTAFLERAD